MTNPPPSYTTSWDTTLTRTATALIFMQTIGSNTSAWPKKQIESRQ